MNKLYFITLSLALTSVFANAQKLDKPIIDKMTGDTTFRTTEEKIFSSNKFGGEGWQVKVYGLSIKGKKYLAFRLNVRNGRNSSVFSIDEGAKAYIKLTDNSIIALSCLQGTVTKNLVNGTAGIIGTYGEAVSIYDLPKDVIEKLKGATVTMVRIESSIGNLDYELKDSAGKIVGKDVELISSVH